jgi:hypothetical protein
MAFRLSKSQLTAWERRIGAARASLDALNDVIISFNRTLASAGEPLRGAAQAYNSALRELQSTAEKLAGDWRSTFNERTDRWQDGYRGQAANEWIEAWENYSPEDAEFDPPDEVEEQDDDPIVEAEELPTEVKA